MMVDDRVAFISSKRPLIRILDSHYEKDRTIRSLLHNKIMMAKEIQLQRSQLFYPDDPV